ncbi:MAG: macro domain-containing protein [Candidatus Diapherotrites archaeon]|nr:macro domain-containing protein [Candidatus Diapherotrites archaeon]
MITIHHKDITEINADVIVNAANEYLQHKGGVALAIANKAGEDLIRESEEYVQKHGPLKTTGVAVTTAGNLNAKYVIHAVGPRGTNEMQLQKTIENVMKKAMELEAKTIALPAISCGIFGFDKKLGAKVIYETVLKYRDFFDEIKLVSTDNEIVKEWRRLSTIY